MLHARWSFSPTTCLALIDTLSDEQVEHECNFVLPPKTVESISMPNTRHSGKNNVNLYREALREHFKLLIGLGTETITSSADNLTHLISRHVTATSERLDHANKQLEELQKQIDAANTLVSDITKLHTPPDPSAPRLSPTVDGNDNTTGTECPFEMLSNVCCDQFTVDSLTKDIKYDKSFRNRRVAYYGKYPYNYTGGQHRARDFSESPYLSSILEKLDSLIPNLKYNSAMVTLYNSPDASIPPHSDNEESIVADSNITTLSLGTARPVVFRKKPPGDYKKEVLNTTHGSVYTMTRRSQDVWDHSVPKNPRKDYTGPRVSITLRLLEEPKSSTSTTNGPTATEGQKTGHPQPKTSNLNPGRPLRVLILSDSKNRTFDCSLLKDPIVAFRQDLFHLRNLERHRRSIEQSDVVLISAGINDLKHGRVDPRQLHNHVKQFTSQFPNIQFVFDSVSPLTLNADRFNKLNDSIDYLNKLLVQLSFRSPNFKLFDNIYFGLSHLAKDGLHFNDSGKNVLSMCWVHVILITLGFRSGALPLRLPFQSLYQEYLNTFV